MKKSTLCLLSLLVCSGLWAQSVNIQVVASSDGVTYTTNNMVVSDLRVKGLLIAWGEDCKNKTNANPPVAALTFGQFIAQEIGDKGAEYQNKGVVQDLLSWGVTNPPAKLISAWPNLSPDQKTNAVNYHKEIGN